MATPDPDAQAKLIHDLQEEVERLRGANAVRLDVRRGLGLRRRCAFSDICSQILTEEAAALKVESCSLQAIAEVEEEARVSKLLRRLGDLLREKGELAIKAEEEEEYIINVLQKRMLLVRRAGWGALMNTATTPPMRGW